MTDRRAAVATRRVKLSVRHGREQTTVAEAIRLVYEHGVDPGRFEVDVLEVPPLPQTQAEHQSQIGFGIGPDTRMVFEQEA